MTAGSRARALRLLAGLSILAGPAVGAAAADAARLAGGAQQAAIDRAFAASGAGRGQTIVSTRLSTVAPGWAAVASVRTSGPERARGLAGPLLPHLTYLHRVGAGERPASPPAAARADLSRPLRVAVIYSGSGSEAIADGPTAPSGCPAPGGVTGTGGVTESESVTVSPMSWTIRWIVDLDRLQTVIAGPAGRAIAPTIAFAPAGSHVAAQEEIGPGELGSGCTGPPVKPGCRATYRAGGPGADGALSILPGGGLRLAVPTVRSPSGPCDPADLPLGPSLWDSGATTAVVPELGLAGGSLPADPYAPVAVAWPQSADPASAGLITSPCAGAPGCREAFAWRGSVRISPVG